MPVKPNPHGPTLHLNLFSFLSAVISAIREILCFGARESTTCFCVCVCVCVCVLQVRQAGRQAGRHADTKANWFYSISVLIWLGHCGCQHSEVIKTEKDDLAAKLDKRSRYSAFGENSYKNSWPHGSISASSLPQRCMSASFVLVNTQTVSGAPDETQSDKQTL